MFHVIERALVQPNQELVLYYSDGERVVVDFKPVIARGGVFARLADPAFFAQVAVGERGRYIEWPGSLDFCADALWKEGHHDAAPEPATMRQNS